MNLKNSTAKLGFLIMALTALSGCKMEQRNAVAQQQHFICKSLIDGFLKSQYLNEYELREIRPKLNTVSSKRLYTYKVTSDHNFRVNTPQRELLKFECKQNSAQQFQVQFFNQEHSSKPVLLSLNLPSKEVIQQMTAFSLKK